MGLVGQDFDLPAAKKQAPDSTATKTKTKVITDKLDRPFLKMFFYNRLIVDEFHDCSSRASAVINAL
jgi:hypothetical protein